ncbi:PAS domain-containing protein [Streptomyces sp. NPDC086766]|uniref:PAS domain-containing protein n=1 Tax=Streptomyces sp. NPDC086766 TaxID=3365754 RepID=UPI00381EDB61
MARGPGHRGGVSRKGVRDVVEDVRPGGERERRLSPAESGLWHRVVEQLGTAVTVIDPAGRIVAVNPAAERLLGRPATAMYGQDLHDLCHRDPGGARIARALPIAAGPRCSGTSYRCPGRSRAARTSPSPVAWPAASSPMCRPCTDCRCPGARWA